MLSAANYSYPLVDLLRRRRVQVDRLKCPAWPDLVALALEIAPTYVHLPLRVGCPGEEPENTETDAPPDWGQLEEMLRLSDTPYVNVHLEPLPGDLPGGTPALGPDGALALDRDDDGRIALLTERMVRQVRSVQRRFGAERVIVENCLPAGGRGLPPGYLPWSITRVVRECDCGLLLDLSHARRTAHELGIDILDYLRQLPLDRTREVHVSGVRRFDQFWVDKARRGGVDEDHIQALSGRFIDHLAMTEKDWALLQWFLDRPGRGQPWVVALEYGGVGGRQWEALADETLVEDNVVKLHSIIKAEGA